MSALYLCAAGNPEGVRLALEVNAAQGRWDRILLLDDDPGKQGQNILGVPVIGPFSALADHQPGDQAVNLVARTTRGRDAARAAIEAYGITLTSLIHPGVNLHTAQIGHAVTLYEGCMIAALSQIGDHAVIFTRAVLGHGACLAAGAVMAPGAVVNARVRVGARAYIGTNAAVMPDLRIGADATVSACSAVLGDVPDGVTMLGVPAEAIGGATPSSTAAPDPELVTRLQSAFARALGVAAFAADGNFFDSGGSSKAAVGLHLALTRDHGLPLSIVEIFRAPTPRGLAARLSSPTPPQRPSRAEMRARLRHATPRW
ncbi:MAG: hypothetical protein JJT99_11325 [Rhodobacteraceae bacterium]|nr:hypothetical protein [Paracoccaceae bacterium]